MDSSEDVQGLRTVVGVFATNPSRDDHPYKQLNNFHFFMSIVKVNHNITHITL